MHARSTSPATTRRVRPSARTAGSSAASTGTSRHGPADQVVYGIVQGGVEQDLRVESAETVAASRCGGIAIGGSLGQDKPQMHEVVGWTTAALERVAPERPRHLLGIGDIDDLLIGVGLGIDTFDCAMPTRLARHGVAIVPDPAATLACRPRQGALARLAGADHGGLPLPGLQRRLHARLHPLRRQRPARPPGPRLLTLHNLSFIQRLMADLRDAIDRGDAHRDGRRASWPAPRLRLR